MQHLSASPGMGRQSLNVREKRVNLLLMYKMKRFSLLLCAVFACVLVSCATSRIEHASSLPPKKPGLGLLIVSKPFVQHGSAYGTKVVIDGVKVASLAAGSYTFCYLKPGKHQFQGGFSGLPGAKQEFLIRSGETKYLQLSTELVDTLAVGSFSPGVGALPISPNYTTVKAPGYVKWEFVSRKTVEPMLRSRRMTPPTVSEL